MSVNNYDKIISICHMSVAYDLWKSVTWASHFLLQKQQFWKASLLLKNLQVCHWAKSHKFQAIKGNVIWIFPYDQRGRC